ncbi:MAG: hypothetical protein GC164_06585 [Phycisphaera sp.]|nr:hypothetical protein [Phycisphaera sp.]
MKTTVIIPAAGVGKRYGAGDKLEEDLDGRAVLLRSIEVFASRRDIASILVAVNPDTFDDFVFKWNDRLIFHGVKVVMGGRKERWETVRNALEHVGDDCTQVAIHDAARPLTSKKLVDRVFEAAEKYEAVIPGQPVSATLKRVADVEQNADEADPLDRILGSAGRSQLKVQRVTQTLDRRNTVEVQTPQVFTLPLIRQAYARIEHGEVDTTTITDDAGLVEAMGHEVFVVEGEATNLKITRPDDILLARAVWNMMHKDKAADVAKKKLFGDEED